MTRQFDDILLRHCNAVYNQNTIDRWMKGCILPFSKKGDLGLAKNYRSITLTSIAAKIYNALLRNPLETKIDNILRKNQNGVRRTSQILTIRRILEGVRQKTYRRHYYLSTSPRPSIPFTEGKKRSRRYPAKAITDADYADDIAILANTPNQAEILLHSFERAAAGIGLHVNAHKTEYMCYNQTGDISAIDGTSLKLVDKLTYQGSSVSSTEKDIDTRLTKAWTAIDRL